MRTIYQNYIDIGIYIKPNDFSRLRAKVKNRGECDIELSSYMGDHPRRLWIAFGNQWRGFFEFGECGWGPYKLINWNSRSGSGIRKPFGGFTYDVPKGYY